MQPMQASRIFCDGHRRESEKGRDARSGRARMGRASRGRTLGTGQHAHFEQDVADVLGANGASAEGGETSLHEEDERTCASHTRELMHD